MNAGRRAAVRELAGLYGVQTAYLDVDRRRRQASPEALAAVLRALGAGIETPRDAASALRERRLEVWRRTIEPAAVAWDGRVPPLTLRLPGARPSGRAACRIETEGGDSLVWTVPLDGLPIEASVEVEGEAFIALGLALPDGLPMGYHRLTVETAGGCKEALVLSAPARAYAPAGGKRWGVFLPLYALRSGRDWGAGDLGGLADLAAWTAGIGGRAVATLPLLPAFLGGVNEPLDPSPYSPVSRLFWNEFYIDVTAVPELARCPAACRLVASPEFQQELEELRAAPLVEYRRVMRLKRRVLESVAQTFFAAGEPGRLASFRAFLAARPAVEDYARFRAAVERFGSNWRSWPEPIRSGTLGDADVDVTAKQYHLYVQWISNEQMQGLSERSRASGVDLYFDLPLGVHPDGYDAWRERDTFAGRVSAGAPPDTFFARGQDWGFAPPHPERTRESGHRYFIDTLRHHLAVAGALRIDHVMGLHRLYWIPEGMDAADGVYVRYPAEEMYAVLSIESHRRRAIIVGEDLGTVPRRVRAAMARHHIQRTYVLQYEVSPGCARPVAPAPRGAVASLNTHDMPPFAAFWAGLDIADHVKLGLLGNERAADLRERLARTRAALIRFLCREGLLDTPSPRVAEALRACLRLLAGNASRLVLVNLEDLWLETEPQNVPGTRDDERPNWRRKAARPVEALRDMPEVAGPLREIGRLRRQAGGRR